MQKERFTAYQKWMAVKVFFGSVKASILREGNKESKIKSKEETPMVMLPDIERMKKKKYASIRMGKGRKRERKKCVCVYPCGERKKVKKKDRKMCIPFTPNKERRGVRLYLPTGIDIV